MFIKGEENEIADWLSRRSTEISHSEVPLKEELVINEVSGRMEGNPVEYESEYLRLAEMVKQDNLSKGAIKEFSQFLGGENG